MGEVAAQTRLSVRAVPYYDQVGLVSPCVRTVGGHRLYGPDDIRRLCAVALLRMAGMSTAHIKQHLASSDWDLAQIIEDQLGRLDSQLTALGTLRHRLAEIIRGGTSDEPTLLWQAGRAVSTPYSAHKAVALLPYNDVSAAQAWLGAVFGLPPGPTVADPNNSLQYASVVTGQGLVHLHPATNGLRPPSEPGAGTAMIVVTVDDVDQLADRVRGKGALITHGPNDMSYGVRELGAADLAGHVWCFHHPLHPTGEQP